MKKLWLFVFVLAGFVMTGIFLYGWHMGDAFLMGAAYSPLLITLGIIFFGRW